MFEMLIHKCRICGGYSNFLLVGDRCCACAYTPAGRPIGDGGSTAGHPFSEAELRRLVNEIGLSEVVERDAEDEPTFDRVRLVRRSV